MYKAMSIEGRDASDFLQRLTTVDMREAEPGKGAKGLYLTGTGKLIASFFLLVESPSRFLLVAESGCYEELRFGLEAMHFSEALEIRSLDDRLHVVRSEAFPPEEYSLEARWFSFNKTAFPLPVPGYALSFDGPEDAGFFESARIEAGFPVWGHEGLAERSALDYGYLQFVHRFKGCYPGQEVVERSLNLGHPARTLLRLRGKTPAKTGDPIRAGDTEAGHVTSAAFTPGGSVLVLGVVQWKHKDRAEFVIGGAVFFRF